MGSDPKPTPSVDRRGFLLRAGMVLQALAAAVVAVPVLGYLLASFRGGRDERKWVRLGPVGEFPEGRTRMATYRNPFRVAWDGEADRIPCWVRRVRGETFQVFSVHCTHLGCPVRWFQESGLFMCPCHGGVFYADGSRAAGPPPRDLYRYRHKVERGDLWILGGRLPTLGQGV